MPADSSWKTPKVLASVRSWYVRASSSGSWSPSSTIPRASLTSFTALPITVRVFKPRKSILSSPSFSMGPMASPVISSGRLGSLYSGTRSMSGSSEITTADA